MKGISIIIPTYNREEFIGETIQSILIQEYDNIEIVISDDGSTDETLEIAKTFSGNIKILRKPKTCLTQGVSSTRNRGIKVSTQPYVCFLDSDDFYLPGHLKKMAEELDNNPFLGFAFCRTLYVKEENGKRLYREFTHHRILKNDIKNPVVSRSNVVHTSSLMFRREVFEKVGTFNESYSNGEDGDLWMRISEQYNGSFLGHFGSAYRLQHGKNQLTNNSKQIVHSCFEEINKKALQRYYDLELNDSNRIFKLKHLVLYDKHRHKIFAYALFYSLLILQYPITFLSLKIPHFYFEILSNKRLKTWTGVQFFLARNKE